MHLKLTTIICLNFLFFFTCILTFFTIPFKYIMVNQSLADGHCAPGVLLGTKYGGRTLVAPLFLSHRHQRWKLTILIQENFILLQKEDIQRGHINDGYIIFGFWFTRGKLSIWITANFANYINHNANLSCRHTYLLWVLGHSEFNLKTGFQIFWNVRS